MVETLAETQGPVLIVPAGHEADTRLIELRQAMRLIVFEFPDLFLPQAIRATHLLSIDRASIAPYACFQDRIGRPSPKIGKVIDAFLCHAVDLKGIGTPFGQEAQQHTSTVLGTIKRMLWSAAVGSPAIQSLLDCNHAIACADDWHLCWTNPNHFSSMVHVTHPPKARSIVWWVMIATSEYIDVRPALKRATEVYLADVPVSLSDALAEARLACAVG